MDSTDKFQNLTQLIKYSIHEEMRDEEGIDTDVLDSHTQQIRGEIEELDRSVRALDSSVMTTEEFEEFADGLREYIESEIEYMEKQALVGMTRDRPDPVE
ncbi:hypothetical protein JCM18237_12710 [Halorubrum luteum]